MKKMRIVFMGTPHFATGILQHLFANKFQIVGVVTAADKPAGRGLKLTESSVKKYAQSQNIPILQPINLKSLDFLTNLKSLQADVFVVVAFRMLPKIIWNIPKMGTFNLHASLLPEYRGAAPIHWAIINGEKKTGVTTFFIDDEIDTGEIIFQSDIDISDTETVGTLHDKLMHVGAILVAKTLENIATGNIKTTKQIALNKKLAPKLTTENTRIDWNESIENIYNKIRGLNPFPAAWTIIYSNNEKIAAKIYDVKKEEILHSNTIGKIISTNKTLKVAVKNGFIELIEIKLSGKRQMDVKSLLNGFEFSEDSNML